MVKIKHRSSIDCVVGGYRPLGRAVGHLLLGLYDDEGRLHYVGSTWPTKIGVDAHSLAAMLPGHGFTGTKPGQSRWRSDQFTEWTPLAPHLVAEVEYDQFSSSRFRHHTRFLRWRFDKHHEECRIHGVLPATGGFPNRTSTS